MTSTQNRVTIGPCMEDSLTTLFEKEIDGTPSLSWVRDFLLAFPNAELFIVGGAVRDAILNRPVTDYDFVVRLLDVDTLESWLEEHGSLARVGAEFGVYKFLPHDVEGIPMFDIALPRTEVANENTKGRYRDFEIQADSDISIETDLARRDFTMNAIAYEIRSKILVDPFKGQRDIEAQIVRAVGNPDRRMKEDASRVLRAMRFSCQLGFFIDPNTWEAVVNHVGTLNEKDDIGWIVSREVLGKEFVKSFVADPHCTLLKFNKAGVFTELFPNLPVNKIIPRLQDAAGLPPLLLFALFFSENTPDECRKIAEAFHFNQLPRTSRLHIHIDDLVWVLRSAHAIDILESVESMRGTLFERLFLNDRGELLIDYLELTRDDKTKAKAIRKRKFDIISRLGKHIPELVSGADLIERGHEPGPEFRKLLARIRDAQLDGRIKTKDEAFEIIKESE